jgi:hypothetical protein
MAVYGDTHEVLITIQALRALHGDIELIIVDNNPPTPRLEALCALINGKYVPFPTPKGTSAARNEIFKHATKEIVVVIDPHIVILGGGLHYLRQLFTNKPADFKPLVHGPLMADNLTGIYATHMDPIWGEDHSFGKWGQLIDNRANNVQGEPFEIPMHGLGLFACRRIDWLEWPQQLEGFGGEEGMVHQMWKMHGRPILCLPGLRWWHCFRHSNEPTPYSQPRVAERFRNYVVWARYLHGDESALLDKFLTILPDVEFRHALNTIGPIQPLNIHQATLPDKQAEPELSLPWWKQGLNYGKALTKYYLAGAPQVTEEEYKTRLELCKNCPTKQFRESDGKCAACTCIVEQKALMRTEQCPHNHWPLQPGQTAFDLKNVVDDETPPAVVVEQPAAPVTTMVRQPDSCDHPSFAANVDINKLTSIDRQVISAKITIRCEKCGRLMKARGTNFPPDATCALHNLEQK